MSDDQEAVRSANFAQLQDDFFRKAPGARKAAANFGRRSRRNDKSLFRLLRHHSQAGIRDDETWERDGFDNLLSFYSLVELGCLAGYLGDEFPVEFVDNAYGQLGHPALREYYESNYSLVLPTLFRLRLETGSGLLEKSSNEAYESFATFLEITRPLELESSLETFLWFLDGGWRDGFDIDDTIEALADQETYLRSLSSQRKTPLQKSVVGFGEFLRFCRAFHALLRIMREGDVPNDSSLRLLASAYWHYHAYWFRGLRKQFGRRLAATLNAFENWEVRANTDRIDEIEDEATHSDDSRDDSASQGRQNSLLAYRRSREEIQEIIKDLASEENGAALLSAVQKRYSHMIRG